MKLLEATIVLMEKEHERTYAEASKGFDPDAGIPLIEITHTRGNMTNSTWPDMTIADAKELRDALTILIDEKEEA